MNPKLPEDEFLDIDIVSNDPAVAFVAGHRACAFIRSWYTYRTGKCSVPAEVVAQAAASFCAGEVIVTMLSASAEGLKWRTLVAHPHAKEWVRRSLLDKSYKMTMEDKDGLSDGPAIPPGDGSLT